MVFGSALAAIWVAMKNLKRLVFGVLSSLLLAVGFTRAADRLDPMSQSVLVNEGNVVTASTPDCGSLCDVVDPTS